MTHIPSNTMEQSRRRKLAARLYDSLGSYLDERAKVGPMTLRDIAQASAIFYRLTHAACPAGIKGNANSVRADNPQGDAIGDVLDALATVREHDDTTTCSGQPGAQSDNRKATS